MKSSNYYITTFGLLGSVFVYLLKCIIRPTLRMYEWYLRYFSKVDRHTIVFLSQPDYADNSRVLSEYIVANGYKRQYKIFFVVHDVKYCKCKFPDAGVEFLPDSYKINELCFQTLRVLYKASWIFSTHGIGLSRTKARKEQHIIRLWHGCSFKDRLLGDFSGKRSFDYALVAGPLFVETKSYFWNVDKTYILPLGYPRYDLLLNQSENASRFIHSHKSREEKLVIWMPTFRNDKTGICNETEQISQFPLIKSDSDWDALDIECKHNNIILLVKLHPRQRNYPIPFASLTNIRRIDNVDLDDAGITLYELLAQTDALISDYSSVAVDYLVVNKPISFTLDDFEAYRKLRGFVFPDPRPYMPGHHLYIIDDLFAFLKDVSSDNDRYKSQRQEMRGLAIHESENYCKEILSELGL